MGWHIEDVSIYKNSEKHCKKYGVDKYIFYTNNPPIYTIVFFMNNAETDYRGTGRITNLSAIRGGIAPEDTIGHCRVAYVVVHAAAAIG